MVVAVGLTVVEVVVLNCVAPCNHLTVDISAPAGEKRYPSVVEVHCVEFFPGATAKSVPVEFWIPKIARPPFHPEHIGLLFNITSI